MIGFWLQAMKVPKRAITVLNQLGVSVSYDSIRVAVKAVSLAALKRMRNVVKSGKLFGICWDNLALPNNKKETTEMNRGSLDHCTTSYMYELVVPPPQDASSPTDVQAYEEIMAALAENSRRKRIGIPRELHQQKKMVPYRACGARPCLERPISTERHSTKTGRIYWLHAPHSACVRKHTPRTGVGTQR
jgi:hypothetical protein